MVESLRDHPDGLDRVCVSWRDIRRATDADINPPQLEPDDPSDLEDDDDCVAECVARAKSNLAIALADETALAEPDFVRVGHLTAALKRLDEWR